MSMVERSYHFDEANSAQSVPVTFRLMQEGLNAFSSSGNFYLSLLVTVTVLAGFIAVVYFLILPEDDDIRIALLGKLWPTQKHAHSI